MSAGAVKSVVAFECAKLKAQPKVSALLAACVIGPFAFILIVRLQSSLPEDTLFGRAMNESGLATPLVVLGFAAWWVCPVLASVVSGDLLAAEDRYGTWTTVLTRSRSRSEVYAGKVLAALVFTGVAVTALALSSVTAGVLVVGLQPLIDLSGVLLAPAPGLARVVLAWSTVLPPTFGFTALALMTSAASRSVAAGIGLPVLMGVAMEFLGYIDSPDAFRSLLLTSAFDSWHGLFLEHPFYGPLVHGLIASAAYAALFLAVTYRVLRRRDFA